MRTLYLLRPHGTAALDGEQLVVRSQEEELDRLVLPLLDQIMVLGKMQLTTQLVRACLKRGIPFAYLSRHGHCLGRLQPMKGGFRHRGRRQAALSESRRLEAKVLIAGKIANARVVLQRLTRRDGRDSVQASLQRLAQLQGRCLLALDADHRAEGWSSPTSPRCCPPLGTLPVRSNPAMPNDPTDALVEALLPIVFSPEPLEPIRRRHLRLVTPPAVLSRRLRVVEEPPSQEP